LHKIFGVCGSISQLFVWLVLLLAAESAASNLQFYKSFSQQLNKDKYGSLMMIKCDRNM